MMSEPVQPGDPLPGMIERLQRPVPIADGLPARTSRRKVRLRMLVAARTVAMTLALVLVTTLVVHRSASSTTVTFTLNAAEVRSVTLVGDFTDWRTDRVELQPSGSGLWRATLKLPPGRYRYAYLVNHADWRRDAAAPSAPDDFGRPTSVLTVGDR